MDKIWNIPLYQRVIRTDFGAVKTKLMELDNIGFFYKYNNEKNLDPDFIRRHIQLREATWALVKAPTVTQAINKFYEEWDGAKKGGGKKEESKALWIDRNLMIRETPSCPLLNKNKEGQYICGVETFNGNGEYGMCVLEQYDAPSDCPIADYNGKIFELEQKNRLPIKKIIIKGREYKYLLVKDVLDVSDTFKQHIQKVLL